MLRDVQDPERLEEMIEELGGKQVRYDGQTTWGLLGAEDELLHDALEVVAADEMIRVPTGAIETLDRATGGEPIHVDGVPYKVREPPRRTGDGAMLRVWLQEG
ncbi:MAG: hypothetical protein ACOC5E_01915 [Acidobacteriota bacterium]